MTLYNILKKTGADLAVQRVEFDGQKEIDYSLRNDKLDPQNNQQDLNDYKLWEKETETANSHAPKTEFNVYIYNEIKADHEIINKIIQEFADKIVIDSTFTTIIGISDYEATEIIRRVGDAKEVYQKM